LRCYVSAEPSELHGCGDDAGGHLKLIYVLDLGVHVVERQNAGAGYRPYADRGHLQQYLG